LGAAPDVTRVWFDSPRGIAMLWAGVLAGPLAWLFDLSVSYALVQWVCGGGSHGVLHLISLGSLVLIAIGAFSAWQALQRAPGGDREDGSAPEERGRFMAAFGLVMCALFATLVIAQAIPRWVLDACQQ
jgi:purine-cytosine permease-like protein